MMATPRHKHAAPAPLTGKAEEPTHESMGILPNLRNQRAHLAGIAHELTRAEIEERAGEVGIDLSELPGDSTKADVVERVQGAARPGVITPS
jgi:hypothetical protein